MSIVRSIRRQIARNNGWRWEDVQKRRYGKDYYAICLKHNRKRWHGRYDPLPKTEPASMRGLHVAAREAIRNRLSMHPARDRERKVNEE